MFGSRRYVLSPSPAVIKKHKAIVLSKADIIKGVPAAQDPLPAYVPKIGDGLGIGIARIGNTIKATANRKSGVAFQLGDAGAPEDEHIYHPYQAQPKDSLRP